MSPRAAWRLEALGFTKVYDFVAGKTDWFACGHPREGTSTGTPWAGDLVRERVPTCLVGVRLEEAREAATESELGLCVVLNDERIVAGALRGDALAKDPGARVEDVMELGPRTIRPSKPIDELLRKRSSQGVKSWIVTTAHAEFLGVLTRTDAELAVARASADQASA
jgi:CBS domain-containing protein